MKVSLVVPIFNEEELLPVVLERIRQQPFDKELILVDDCSTDRTPEILAAEAHKPDAVVVRHERNMGKGRSIRTGLQHARGDIVLIQDADLEYDPAEIPRVLAPLLDGTADVVFGSRFLGEIRDMRLPNRVANHILAWTATLLYGKRITDEATAYKAFRREVLQVIPLRCRKFEFCPEITAKVLRRRLRLVEVPVSYTARTFAQGKKIGWRDFVVALWTLLRYRFRD